ncbi:hypothetical protein BGZ67_007748 [Mortierella alpina]|nr:hypothetical protein BGZ67_007748 [Mortierella alpina]
MVARTLALSASLGVFLFALQSARASESPQLGTSHKRGDTVYVTVTEVRYVPIPAPAPATAAPAVTMRPASVKPDLDHVGAEAPAYPPYPRPILTHAHSIPAPVVDRAPAPLALPLSAMWYSPDDALTFTSYAGLLTTMAPAFYPTPSLFDAPPVMPASAPVPAPPASLPPAASTTAPSMTAASPASTRSSVADKATPTTAVATSTQASSRSTMDGSITVSDEKADTTTTSTTTSIDITVSTTTTTQGSTTRTTTSVGTDGTTTVLTEYPTSTRPRGPQNTSGAQAGQSRGRLVSNPRISSAFEYTTGCAILGPAWLALAMTIALAAGCPLLLWV